MAYNKQARLDNKLSRLANDAQYGNPSTSEATPTYLKLLAEGANAFSAIDDSGESVFHHWADIGNAACLEAAVKTIDLRRIDDIGEYSKETPVALAVGMWNFDCAKILIEAGADITRWDWKGNTVLHTLAEDDRGADCIRAALRIKPERVDVTSYSGDTALMKAARRGTMDCLNVLLEGGAAVDHQDKRGRSVLMVAARAGELGNMNRLLEAGANMTLRDEEGNDALMYATDHDESDCLDTLIQVGADVNAKNDKGRTALMIAVEREKPKSVKALIDAGADPMLTDNEGHSAADKANLTTLSGRECHELVTAAVAEKRAAELDRKLEQTCDSWAPPEVSSSTHKAPQAQQEKLTQVEHQAPVSRSRQRF